MRSSSVGIRAQSQISMLIRPARPRCQKHPAALRVAQRVGEQVADHPLQQQRVAVDRDSRAAHAQRKSLGGGQRREFLFEQLEHFVDQDLLEPRLDRSGIEA
jgi:hypothetical protein